VNNGDFRHCREVFVEKNGLKTGFLGYSLRPRQYFTEEPLYAEGERERIVEDVRRTRAVADAVVVSLHWGDEFIDRPSPDEIDIAHAVMDAGADLIIGHHPHVLRGVERYGRGYIVYSLGNFVCDMIWDEPLRETAIVQCRLTAEGVKDFSLIPVRINDDYQPEVLQGAAAQTLLARVQVLSDRLQELQSNPGETETMEQYGVAAHDAHAKSRARSHRYFLRNAYRFPPGLVVQQLGTYFRNRLAERGLIKPPPPTPGC
jgi:poly-gamma-glutamate synthesis protein (capsule biosynthesis protein)